MLLWALMFALIVLTDQIIKYLVISRIEFENSVSIINNFIYLSPTQNKAITIGIFQIPRYLYVILILVIFSTFFYYMIKNMNTFIKLSVTLIASGVVGNLADFILKGNVIDFIKINIWGLNFPNFNIADIFIVSGVTTFITYVLNLFKDSKRTKEAE